MIKSLKTILLLIIIPIQLSAQQKTEFSRRPEPDPNIRNLKVGDRVPEIQISKIIRYIKPSAKLSDFKDRLLILDFWDTFCGSCIEALPKLDSLQKQFGDRIKILPVSYQAEEVITTFFKTNKLIKNIKLPCVVEDKTLGSYFQYKLISHEVWIYKGIVVAITGTDYVTTRNIQTILNGEKVNWPVKNDMVRFNPKQPIFKQTDSDQYNIKSRFLKYSGITGHREGIDYKTDYLKQNYDSAGHYYRTSFYNYPIVLAFHMITSKIRPKDFIPHPDRLVLEVNDTSKYVFNSKNGFSSDWHRENEICYELVSAKPMKEEERLEYIYSDLQRLLGLNVRWEKRPLKCLVIVKKKEVNIDSLNKTRKGQKIVMHGIPLFYLDQQGKYPPAIDETGIKKIIVIEDLDPTNYLDQLRKQLEVYGCDIIEVKRHIDVLVITETTYKK